MKVRHVQPEGWVDTEENGVIQPSEVAGLVHEIELEEGDLLQGPPGPQGEPGPQGPQGEPGAAGGGVAGMVAAFAMSVAPAGWLECDGAAVSRVAYAALFAAIGTVYGAGDGATTFKLPDLRGEFLRGWDHGRGVDAGRAIASAQGSQNLAHVHQVSEATFALGVASGSAQYYPTGTSVVSSTSSGGNEARPRNVALMYCIATGA